MDGRLIFPIAGLTITFGDEPGPVNTANRMVLPLEAARADVTKGQDADAAVNIKLEAVRSLFGPGVHAELDEVVRTHRIVMTRACEMFELAHSQAVSECDRQTVRAVTAEEEQHRLADERTEAADLKTRALTILVAACNKEDGGQWAKHRPDWYRAAVEAGFYEEPPF